MHNIESKKSDFITALIPRVIEHGWDMYALEQTSISIAENENYWAILFDNISSVVDYFEHREDLRMLKSVEFSELNGIRGKIAGLLQFRIKEISGGAEMWRRLRSFYTSPKAISHLTKNSWNTSDVIWSAIGDKSTDINYYTKRFLLSGVYAASIKYFLSRKSDNIDHFIVISLDKIVKIAGYKKYLKMPKWDDIPILRLFG